MILRPHKFDQRVCSSSLGLPQTARSTGRSPPDPRDAPPSQTCSSITQRRAQAFGPISAALTTLAVAMPDAQIEHSEAEAPTLLCTIATGSTLDQALLEISEAASSGAAAVELRLDFYSDFNPAHPDAAIRSLVAACRGVGLQSIFTCRAAWEGCVA